MDKMNAKICYDSRLGSFPTRRFRRDVRWHEYQGQVSGFDCECEDCYAEYVFLLLLSLNLYVHFYM